MDLDFLIYKTRMDLWQLLLADWKTQLVTVKYWGIVAFIVIAYMVWFRLTDKRRLVDLMFYGSLIAVMRGLIDLAGVTTGAWMYKERLLPLSPSVFLQDWTIMPLTYMLVAQYSANWRQFFLWNAVGTAFLTGLDMPIMVSLGILQFMNWGYIQSFGVMYVAATLCRAAFHLVVQVQERAREGNPAPLLRTVAQPALKPMPGKEDGGDDDREPTK
jgi:hypothetical protein